MSPGSSSTRKFFTIEIRSAGRLERISFSSSQGAAHALLDPHFDILSSLVLPLGADESPPGADVSAFRRPGSREPAGPGWRTRRTWRNDALVGHATRGNG